MTFTQKLILSLQVSGFVVSLVVLFILAAPHWIFVVAFGVHVVGDVLFIITERLLGMTFKISNYIKPLPWAQFVGHMVFMGALVGVLTGHHRAFWVALSSVALAGAIYGLRLAKKLLPTNDAALRLKLQLGGLAAALVGAVLLRFAPHAGAWVGFIGTGVSMADFCYDLIYQ